jgi:hypothetical protein
MYKIDGTTIRLTRGDSFAAEIWIKRNDEYYTPVEGDVITFSMKKTYLDGQPLITKVIPNDSMQLVLDPSDTASLPFGEYVYDIDIIFVDGSKDTFIYESKFILAPEV